MIAGIDERLAGGVFGDGVRFGGALEIVGRGTREHPGEAIRPAGDRARNVLVRRRGEHDDPPTGCLFAQVGEQLFVPGEGGHIDVVVGGQPRFQVGGAAKGPGDHRQGAPGMAAPEPDQRLEQHVRVNQGAVEVDIQRRSAELHVACSSLRCFGTGHDFELPGDVVSGIRPVTRLTDRGAPR